VVSRPRLSDESYVRAELRKVERRTDLTEMSYLNQPQELSRAMSIAQTGAQKALNEVNEWFRLRKPEIVPRLKLEEIIDICRKCMDKIHPDFDPQITQTIPVLPQYLTGPLYQTFFSLFLRIYRTIRVFKILRWK
jgi:hypothetical protein